MWHENPPMTLKEFNGVCEELIRKGYGDYSVFKTEEGCFVVGLGNGREKYEIDEKGKRIILK